MKNDADSKEKIQNTNSSTSEVVDNVDLTVRPSSSVAETYAVDLHNATNLNEPELPERNLSTTGLDELLQRPTTSGQQFLPDETIEAANAERHAVSQPNLRIPRSEMQMVFPLGGGLINSTNAMHHEHYVKMVNSGKSVGRIPPSYSTVLKLGPPIAHFGSDTNPSIPFIARQPPPSYAEVRGWNDNTSMISGDSFSLGPNPLYLSCPRCRTVVVSDIHRERSHLSYVISLVLCVCFCWPCCLLPLCLKTCRNTYHFCPACHYYIGVYRPC